MTDIERYRHGAQHSAHMAGLAISKEIRELWLTIERSYRFLLERAERTGREGAPT